MSAIGDDLGKELLAVFALEAAERIQTINDHLLALEKALGAKEVDRLLAEIFREAHSLKGAARAVNLTSAEAVAHRLESLLLEMQAGSVGRGRAVFDLIYEAVDAIAAVAAGPTSSGASGVDVDVKGVCERLDAAVASEGEAPGSSAPAPDAGRAVSPTVPDEEPETRPAPGETVRVATAKLDALFASAGELLATRTTAEERRNELHELIDEMEEWQRHWRSVRPSYRRLLLASSGPNHAPNDRRVSTDPEYDDLLEFLDENERRLGSAGRRTRELGKAVDHDARLAAQLTKDVHDEVRRTRMMPVQVVLKTLPRMVRDLSNAHGKRVTLRIEGGNTEVDRAVLEKMGAPLTHLLRNSIDHGIEHPPARVRAGKPDEASVTVRVARQGDVVRIEVADDGSGIDVPRVVEKAVEREVVTAEEARSLSEREALWLVFRSGFSTSPIITDLSGRGVGLDVVRNTIERLHGTIEVDNRPGDGVTFALVLPLTLGTTVTLLVEAAGQCFGLPVTNVVRTVRLAPDDVSTAQGRDVARVNGETLTVAHLGRVLGLPGAAQQDAADAGTCAAVVASGEKRMALLVDGLAGMQEVVLKNLPSPLGGSAHVAAASILGTGELVMVLNVGELIRSSGRAEPGAALISEAVAERDKPASILIADDSITTRTLERNILEAAGYTVIVAADGIEAWTLLQQEPCDLLVSDVNMPRMDGLHLTERIRADARLKDLPVVLVTSLDKPEDRERGVAVGADAYIVKGSFDQDRLLETIRRLV
jgi:two-component system chemotaxis sensor kinase CheA